MAIGAAIGEWNGQFSYPTGAPLGEKLSRTQLLQDRFGSVDKIRHTISTL
jgi:hypothetical protein